MATQMMHDPQKSLVMASNSHKVINSVVNEEIWTNGFFEFDILNDIGYIELNFLDKLKTVKKRFKREIDLDEKLSAKINLGWTYFLSYKEEKKTNILEKLLFIQINQKFNELLRTI